MEMEMGCEKGGGTKRNKKRTKGRKALRYRGRIIQAKGEGERWEEVTRLEVDRNRRKNVRMRRKGGKEVISNYLARYASTDFTA